MKKDKSADGLRGLAALNVFFSHLLLAFFPLGFVHFFPWVAQPGATGGNAERLLSLPVLSILWNGRFPVSIFFVLSGYVLTKQFIQTGDIENLRSKAARRYFRLGIPVFFSVMFAFALWSLGAYQATETVVISHSAWLHGQTRLPFDFPTALREGLYESIFTSQHLVNPSLWTMQVEFMGSMMIFAYRLLAWRGLRGLFIAAIYVALCVLLSPTMWPFYLAFLVGSYIGEWSPPSRRLAWVSFVFGIVIASFDNSRLFSLLNSVPLDFETKSNIYSVVGASFLLYGVRGGVLNRVLQCQPVQFLGRISYSLYLVHLPLVFSVGCGTFNWMVNGLNATRTEAASASLLATLASVLLVGWAFQVLVDERAINLSKRIVPNKAP